MHLSTTLVLFVAPEDGVINSKVRVVVGAKVRAAVHVAAGELAASQVVIETEQALPAVKVTCPPLSLLQLARVALHLNNAGFTSEVYAR